MLAVNQSYTGLAGDVSFNDDTVVMAMAAGTHIDALAHVTYDGQMYNGFPAENGQPRRAGRPAAAPTSWARS